MSASLMSCVRENSPPIDVVDGANCCSGSGPMSLPDCHINAVNQQQQFTSTPLSVTNVNDSCSSGGGAEEGSGGVGTATNAEPKRRRFHPLRNLRRIFRRRTITSVADTPPSANAANTLPPPTSSTSEKNLRSATLSSISSVVSASSPSSPLTHQQLQDAYSSQSLPKSKSYSIGGSGGSGGGIIGGGVGSAVGGNTTKSPHRDALLASALGVKQKHLQTKQQLAQQLQLQLEETVNECEMYTTTTTSTSSMYHHHQHQQVGSSGGVLFQPPHSVRQSLGVAVLPSAMNRSFYAERQKLRSVDDSSQELDSSGNDSGSATGTSSVNNTINGSGSANGGRSNDCESNEMSDSQRSLSEGRLVESDYSHDPLSQSHDSVFSESATASLFSNRDYQAELSDVLRKRNRNRQDASEEDLGLPHSPASPQRRAEQSHRSSHQVAAMGSGQQSTINQNTVAIYSSATGNQSEVSSLSLLSMNSGDGDEILAASTANNSAISTKDIMQERSQTTSLGGRSITRSSTVASTSVSSEIYRHSSSGSLCSDSNRDEPDLQDTKCQRLSHSAAKHKMALRPAKKKGPSRQHRRTLENSIPEANEDGLRLTNNALLDITELDAKAKTRSLPLSVNTRIVDKHAVDLKKITSPSNSKTKTSIPPKEQISNVKRMKVDKLEKGIESTKTTVTTSSSSNSITAATNLFGLRTLTAKATALFETPQESSTDPTPREQELMKEKEKLREKVKEKESMSNTMIADTTESGFLRRLIQRNSKRSIPRPNATVSANINTSVSAGAGEDKIDMSQNESASKSKMQISTSCLDMNPTPESSLIRLDKSRSALSYKQNIEETRKDIKREIMSVGGTGVNAILNTQNLLSTPSNSANNIKEAITSPQKPKMGAAARQRYVPQDIGSLDRKVNAQQSSTNSTTSAESYTSSTSSILSKCSQQEVFQSTSIIREITASQASSVNSMNSVHKSEHHFEKKPKIVGLSAFQQKISRSNDSMGRFANYANANSNSTNSLDTSGDVLNFAKSREQKQRKVVEKSRSFRTYQEDAYANSNTMHNNMPSLPDLTLNLRVPSYNDIAPRSKNFAAITPDRSTSLGYEVNEPAIVYTNLPRTAESANNLTSNNYDFTRNITVKHSPTKLVSVSKTSIGPQEYDDQETNTDLLPKSPFINVLRKQTSITSLEDKTAVATICGNNNRKSVEQNITPKGSSVSLIAVVPPTTDILKKMEQDQSRPKVLQLQGSNTSIDTSTSTDDLKLTPTTAAVPLREKSKLMSNVSGANVRNSMEILAVNAKDLERKSAPAPVMHANKAQSFKTTRHSTSLLDSSPNSQNGMEERNVAQKVDESTSGSNTPNGDGVPEFMRIQLNRVDPARMAKSANVVLAKNMREVHPTLQQQPVMQQQQTQQQQNVTKEANERNTNLEDLCLLRLSSESVEIIEKSSPTEVNKQKSVFDMSQNIGNINDSNNKNKSPSKSNVLMSALPPRSPMKKQPTLVTITPTTPTSPTNGAENALLRSKTTEIPADAKKLNQNKLSLQERKRLFLNEEKTKTDKRIEELRNERKKSITEEVYRKSFAKSEEKLESSEKAASENVVMMRKKSFCASTTQAATATNGNRDDPTPELMKVFARRSLKIKDEDINALADKLHASSCGINNGAKKFVATQQNVDSDKENQSASDEKLDKLPKLEAPIEAQIFVGNKFTNGINNRNSLADFRLKAAAVVGSGATLSNGISLNNSNNNNNNNYNAANSNNTTGIYNTVNNTTFSTTTTNTNNTNTNGINVVGSGSGSGGSNRTSFLPPIKVAAGFRPLPIERNNSVSKIYPTTACETLNNNNNNYNNSNNSNNVNNNHQHQQQQHHHQLNSTKTNERQSLNVKALESSSSNSTNNSNHSSNKIIERSATVSEFKGIHQRRAEWERRAKEALK